MRCVVLFLLVILSAVAPRPASAQYYWFSQIAHTGDPVPGGTGVFIAVGPSCDVAGLVTFSAKGSAGEIGLYAGDGSSAPAVVVDNTLPIPDGQGTYADFGSASRGGDIVVFQATGAGGQVGVFGKGVGPCFLVADENSPIPGGLGNFTDFGAVGTDGTNFAFHAFGSSGQEGIYMADQAVPDPVIVADPSTVIPGGQFGKFTGFYSNSPLVHQGNVAFGGNGSQGYTGYFLFHGGQIVTLVDVTHVVPPAGQSTFSQFGEASLADTSLAFHGYGSGGEEGIYVASGVIPCFLVAQKGDSFDGGDVLTGFGGVAFDGKNIAFIGYGSKEIYANFGGTMRRVISVGDALVGLQVADLDLAPDALGINQVAFRATFTDGSEGVYVGNFVSSGSSAGKTPAASALTVKNEPNPFERTTEIDATLPAAGDVRLEVYDVDGRRVRVRDLGYRDAGHLQVTFDGGALASGVYFCRVEEAGYHATRKLLIER